MRVYESDDIRNVGIIGHGASGKTSLTSAMLFVSGAVNRLGRVEDGNTVTDWEDEEIERKISISSALAYAEWNKHKINLLDTPGYRPFLNDTRLALRVADAAVVLVDAVAGVEVQTEKVWEFADEFDLPRIIVVNKLDRDNASFQRVLDAIVDFFPPPTRRKVQGIHPRTKEPVERAVSSQEPLAAYVFKTVADPFTGRISILRIYSGVMKSDTQYYNESKEKPEKFGP